MAVDETLNRLSAIDSLFCALEVAVIFIWLDLLATTDTSIFLPAFEFEDIADHVLGELLSSEEPDKGLASQLEETEESTNISHQIEQGVYDTLV